MLQVWEKHQTVIPGYFKKKIAKKPFYFYLHINHRLSKLTR